MVLLLLVVLVAPLPGLVYLAVELTELRPAEGNPSHQDDVDMGVGVLVVVDDRRPAQALAVPFPQHAVEHIPRIFLEVTLAQPVVWTQDHRIYVFGSRVTGSGEAVEHLRFAEGVRFTVKTAAVLGVSGAIGPVGVVLHSVHRPVKAARVHAGVVGNVSVVVSPHVLPPTAPARPG